jgi:non-ribosomal peptide synthetase component F
MITRRFEQRTMQTDAATLATILERMVAAPEEHLSELEMLTTAERQQMLIEWNDTAVEYPAEQCIHELFEQQVERSPEAVALVYEAEQVSYRELNERANQLAHYLRQLGVGPEGRVGICVERSVEMVVGLLGILKAGGAYVPLDAPVSGRAAAVHVGGCAGGSVVERRNSCWDGCRSCGCRS